MKRFIKLMLASVAMFAAVWLLLLFALSKVNLPPTESTQVYPSDPEAAASYEIEENRFTPAETKLQMRFRFPERSVCSVWINFAKPVKEDTDIRVCFAAQSQRMSERTSVTAMVKAGKSVLNVQLPAAVDCGQIRLDVEGKVSFSSISVSSESLVFVPDTSRLPARVLAVIWAACLIICVACALAVKYVPKQVLASIISWEKANAHRLDVACLVLTLFFCSCILQAACFSRLCAPPAIPMEICLALAFYQMISRGTSVRRMVLSGVALAFACSMVLAFYIPARAYSKIFYAGSMFLLWFVGPFALARGTALTCLRWLGGVAKRNAWLAVCLIAAALCGYGVESAYAGIKETAMVLRRGVFFAALIFVAFALLARRLEFILKPEKAFVLIALTLGGYFCFAAVGDGRQCWDEEIHYAKATYLSQGVQIEWSLADENILHPVRTVPLSESKLERTIQKLNREDAGNSWNIRLDAAVLMPRSASYMPLTVGIWVREILRLPFYFKYTLGRLANLLFYVIMIYYAIKRLVNGKMLLMVAALLPTSLFLACCYSYDSWITALTYLSIAYFWGALQRPEEKLGLAECVVMLGALLLAMLPKIVYFPLFFIFFLMPATKFRSRKEHKRYILAIAACFALMLLYLGFAMVGGMGNVMTDSRGGDDVDGMRQIVYILTHPFAYAKTLLIFLRGYLSLSNSVGYTTSISYHGNGSIEVLILSHAMLFVTALTDCDRPETILRSLPRKLWCLLCGGAALALVATALYVGFTPVGLDTINGCQPRYFSPLLFPFFALVFHHGTKLCADRRWYNGAFSFLAFYGVASSFWNTFALALVP